MTEYRECEDCGTLRPIEELPNHCMICWMRVRAEWYCREYHKCSDN